MFKEFTLLNRKFSMKKNVDSELKLPNWIIEEEQSKLKRARTVVEDFQNFGVGDGGKSIYITINHTISMIIKLKMNYIDNDIFT